MMKVLLINSVWGGHPGGIDRYITQIIHMLHHNGHGVSLICGRRKGKAMEQNLPLLAEHELPGLEQMPNKRNAGLPAKLLKLAAAEAPDVVFVQDISHYPSLTALQQAYPVVVMFHDYRPICLKDTRRDYFFRHLCAYPLGYHCLLNGHFLRRPAEGSRWPRLRRLKSAQNLLAALKACHHAMTASDYVRGAFLQNGFAPERITTLPLFASENNYNPANSYPREKIVLFVGRLTDRYKGADLLLEALQHCRTDIRLHIAGDGRFAARLKSICEKKELIHRVKFLGWVQGEALQYAYRQAMVVAVPSLWAEPFGLVGLEAMANGTPVIAFDVGGMKQWLRENVTGFLVPWLDTAAMAERIDLLAGNPVLVRQMGLAGFHHVRNEFSEASHLEGLLAIFNRAMTRYHEMSDDVTIH
jgi:glycosyltransferase involved in cell wall biosynthesis